MNEMIFRYLNSLAGQSAFGDKMIIFTATAFGVIVMIAGAVFLARHHETFRKRVKEVSLVFATSAAAWLVSTALKNLIHLPRPYAALQDVKMLFLPDDDFSMPSGHATFFMALATALYFYHRKIGLIFGLAALLVSLARVAAGIHFPADILAGFILGIGVSALVAHLRKKV